MVRKRDRKGIGAHRSLVGTPTGKRASFRKEGWPKLFVSTEAIC